jgi:Fur family peroxide stress response transcriptional regulator
MRYYLKKDAILFMITMEYSRFRNICQSRGVKATSQRYVIFKTLLENPCHPTAEALFDLVSGQLPGMGRDTVYRTLGTLADCGLAKKLGLPGEASHYDGDVSRHHHFVCVKCGDIRDFLWPRFDELPLPEALMELGGNCAVSVLITGLCPACAEDGRR